METVKEKYTIGISIFIIGYLMWRKDNFFVDPIYDHVALSIILLVLWFIFFNHRIFVMTRKRLCSNYYDNNLLEYKGLMVRGIIEDIYVRIKGDIDWYKLDYILTIPNGCGYNIYEEFTNKNQTVGDLLKTMNSKADDAFIGSKYKMMKNNYKAFKYISLIFLILFECLHWLIYNHISEIIY